MVRNYRYESFGSNVYVSGLSNAGLKLVISPMACWVIEILWPKSVLVYRSSGLWPKLRRFLRVCFIDVRFILIYMR